MLEKVRENGRAGCPVPQDPFPLLIPWDAPLATPTSLPEDIPLTDATSDGPTGISHGSLPWEKCCLKVGEACP